jgi:hypothetical protein
MKRLLALLFLFAPAPAAAVAQEPAESELELVAKLRARGYADLAKEYLDLLQKRGDPALSALLPVEQARTLVALAREKEADQRVNMIAAARAELEAYVKQNAGKPQGAQAALELARLSSLQGQAILTQALREDEAKAAHEKARPAEAMFVQAAKDLTAAIKALQAVADDYKNPDAKLEKAFKARLSDDLLHARFDLGINLIDQARTYIDIGAEGTNRKRAEIVEEARKVFDKLAKDDSAAAGTLANAWLMKVSMEQQTPLKTGDYYKRVMAQEGKAYAPAKQWARLFYMQNLQNDPTFAKLKPDEKLKKIETEGRSWVKDYPGALKTPAGQGVLFELANALVEIAKKQKDQKAKAAVDLYADAQKYYGLLAQMDGDLSQKANQYSLALSFQLSGSKTDLATFDDFYQKGMSDKIKLQQTLSKLGDAGGKDRDKLEEQRRQHLKDMALALSRAVGVATSKTPIQKLDDARYNLTAAYIVAGDFERAAVAGEALGRSRSPQSARGAATAIDAYARLFDVDPDESTRVRLKSLADYVLSPESQKQWTGDPVSDYAHYQLAMLHKREDNFKAAVDHLEKLTPTFSGYTYAQGQLVFLAQEAREKAQTPAEKKAWVDAARKALKRMPPPGDKADPTTATMYFMAQMELGKFMFEEAGEELKAKQADKAAARYIEMSKSLAELSERFEKLPVKVSPESRERIEYTLGVLRKYADVGLANVEFNKGNYDAVFKTTQPVVQRVLKDASATKGDIRYKDHQITGDLLGLALRAHIQKGDVAKGQELLAVLQRLQGDGGEIGGDRANVVRGVLQQIGAQVDQLKSSGKKEDLERLKSMVGNFTSFLDGIAKDADKKGFDAEATRMLGLAYASLDQHSKAAAIFAKVAAPDFLDKDPKKLDEKEAEQLAVYWGMRLEYGKALRQGKSKEELTEALKVLDHLLKHPNARYQLLADMEKNLVLEDEEKYSVALLRWGQFMKNPSLTSNLADPKVQKIFFTGAFQRIRCMYQYAMHEAKKESKPKFIKAAASQLIAIEFTPDQVGWTIIEPMARELLAKEAELREEYDKLKAERK